MKYIFTVIISNNSTFFPFQFKNYYKSVESKEIDYTALLQDDDNLDESPSDPVEVSLPKDQDGKSSSVFVYG